jgi:uncharacterized protein
MILTSDEQIVLILKSAQTIAVVGLSGNPEKVSYGVAQYLQGHGYRIIPVNPTAAQILGEPAYADLLAVPHPVDVVQIFRRPEDVPPVVEQAVQIGARVVWMQEGIVNQEAAGAAAGAGLQVVMDRCMRQEHIRLLSTPSG